MATNNIGLIFNKTYYSKIDEYYKNKNAFLKDLKIKNEQIFGTTFCAHTDYKAVAVPEEIARHRFCMSTVYPGLLVGLGYSHGSGLSDANDDINVGFSFDYVTGLPYIPASSVKGLLKSAFSHPKLIEALLGDDKWDGKTDLLENAIFVDEDGEQTERDIFFDAVIRFSDRADKRILGSDYITPHKEETKNPTPVLIIKLLPDVVIEFSFRLTDTKLDINDESIVLTADDKKALFINILSVLGIGAKTNVGYGTLVSYTKAIPEKDALPIAEDRTPPVLNSNGGGKKPYRKNNYGGNKHQGGRR